VKLLIVVKDRAPVTLTVPAAKRSRLAFDYGRFAPPLTRNGIAFFRIADAPQALTFKPCSRAKTPSGWTQFAGGFIVKGAQCARVYVSRGRTRLHPKIALGESCS
jgi:Tfp pilus assembly protein FimT